MSQSHAVTPSPRHSVTLLCWQGWQLELPNRWNPTKIEGDYDSGAVMIADLHRPRLGLRWKRAAKKLDKAKWSRKALLDEVGQLAADEARPIELTGALGSVNTLHRAGAARA